MSDGFSPDPWAHLARLTPARIALGRAGAGQPTRAVLDFSLAHARARDAVHAPFDAEAVASAVGGLGFTPLVAHSAALDRTTYLARPDLGRRLDEPSRRRRVAAAGARFDLAFVIADGLSAAAVHAHAVPMLEVMKPAITRGGWRIAPVVVARQARVALGDEIGQALNARAVAVLIGERPGLSAPDSLGVYLTFDPRVGRSDAERNCISNIRAAGLSYDEAAFKLAWLIGEAFRLGLTGVGLKDQSDLARVGGSEVVQEIE